MAFDKTFAAIQSGAVQNFNPESNSVLLTLAHSRGPQPNGSLISVKTTLKDREMDSAAQPHVVFVIDQSGSMQGGNCHAAINVFKTVYNAVSNNTYVSIILFNDKPTAYPIPLSTGTTAVRALKSQIDKNTLDQALSNNLPSGGTNIIGALKATAAVIAQGGMKPTSNQINDTSIIFITDGEDNGFAQYADPLPNDSAEPEPHISSATTAQVNPRIQPPSVDVMLDLLKREMAKDYGLNLFPRIMPIGIGLKYNAPLLMELGSEPAFHRTGFLHVAQPLEVATKKTELASTVDPVRLKTQLFIAYKNGTHELYPYVYLQRGVEATKEYLLDSSIINQVYLIQEPDESHFEITRIVAEIPSHDSLPYNEEILKRFLLAEYAGINNNYNKSQNKQQYPEFLAKITTLLRMYPKDYWGKEIQCMDAILYLNELYIKISDALHNRPTAQAILALQTHSFFQRDNAINASLRASSATSMYSSSSISASSASPYSYNN